MKKRIFIVLFAFFILVLIFLFIFSGIIFSVDKTESMFWIGGKLSLVHVFIVLGLIVIISLSVYFILKNIHKER